MKIDKKPLIREIRKIIKEFLTKYKVSSDEKLHEKFDIVIKNDGSLAPRWCYIRMVKKGKV